MTEQGRFPFSQNFGFTILGTFRFKSVKSPFSSTLGDPYSVCSFKRQTQQHKVGLVLRMVKDGEDLHGLQSTT